MRSLLFLFAIVLSSFAFGQQIEKIQIPEGIVYKYCDSATYEKAKAIVTAELSASPAYSLDMGLLFIGPVIWSRFKEVTALKNIKGGDITILGYKKSTSSGKATQRHEDFKLVWDHLRNEIKGQEFKLRKATVAELRYYWSVISFDIEEPLIIVETAAHNYILDVSAKDFKLTWLDEAPRP